MLKGLICAAVVFAATAAVAHAQEQEWELGVIGGAAFSPKLTVRNATNSASTGVKTGVVLGVYAGEDMYRYWSGEANYLYRRGDLKLEGSGKSVSFGAHTHLITGDFLAHLRPRGAHIRPFISFGGGVEVIVATGEESATQPLGDLAALTATREVLPVGEAGVGVKVQLSRHLRLRVQLRDYFSQAPNSVISPAPGASLSGIRQDVIGTGAIALTW
jgi:Outer membrane protein beta-barrel domain